MTTPCNESIRERLVELAENELPEPERAELNTHLIQCPACRGELQAISRTLHLLHALPRQKAPPDLAAKVRSRVRRRTASRRRAFLTEQRLEITSAVTVLVAAIAFFGVRFLVSEPVELESSSPVDTAPAGDAGPADIKVTVEHSGVRGRIVVLTIPSDAASEDARKVFTVAAESGGTTKDGDSLPIYPTEKSLAPGKYKILVPSEALPLLAPGRPDVLRDLPSKTGRRVEVRVIVE